ATGVGAPRPWWARGGKGSGVPSRKKGESEPHGGLGSVWVAWGTHPRECFEERLIEHRSCTVHKGLLRTRGRFSGWARLSLKSSVSSAPNAVMRRCPGRTSARVVGRAWTH